MENATQAMLIAAGVLIGVLILSLAVALFSELEIYVQSSHERIEFNELNAFNTQFSKYVDVELTIQDVVTAANLAHENNVKYDIIQDDQINEARGNDLSTYVAVFLNGQPIEHNINERTSELLAHYLGETFRCNPTSIYYSEETGRVYQIFFFLE